MTVAAVLLAAGEGARFVGDGHKLRALIDGKSVLEHALESALNSTVDEVILVVGDDNYRDLVDAAVSDNGGSVVTLHSPDWAQGQAHSLAVAIASGREAGHDALVVGLGDQPLVGAATWSALAATTGSALAAANYGGQRRPPTLLRSDVWDQIPATGDHGARQLLIDRHEDVADVPSAGNPADVDTIDALERVRQLHVDRMRVTELLGRNPMGSFEVVVRDQTGSPVVLKNFPVLADGRPMPTLYWLCGERESMLVGRLEAVRGVRRAEADLGLDVINAAHDRYRAERDEILDDSGLDLAHRPTGGVGGTRNGVKCLHAHYGYWLAGGEDPVGQWVADHLDEVDMATWPSTS